MVPRVPPPSRDPARRHHRFQVCSPGGRVHGSFMTPGAAVVFAVIEQFLDGRPMVVVDAEKVIVIAGDGVTWGYIPPAGYLWRCAARFSDTLLAHGQRRARPEK